METHNPYAGPISVDSHPGGDDRILTPEIMEAMAQTRPWVLLLAALGMVGCGLMVLGSLWTAVMIRGFGGFQFVSALAYLAFAAIYLFPCIALLRYGRAIESMQLGQGVPALTDALRHQKSFWRYVGVMSVLLFGIYVVGFVVGGRML